MEQTEAVARPVPVTGPGLAPGYMDFRLRRVTWGDGPRLLEFYRSLSPRSEYFFEPYTDRSLATMEDIVLRGQSGRDLHLVALDPQERIFGHIFYRNVSQEIPHLGIGLLDAYHDRGLGAVLFAHIVNMGRHVLHKQTIGLTVMKENRRALHLYRKHGFRIVRDATFRTPNDSYELWLTFA